MAAPNDLTPPPQPETRLALVMNGGVSLAVWMGGVTHELDLLCRASLSSDISEESAPDADRPVFRIWRSITRSAGRKVLIDIVAGTSAGGLNGLILGTALARGAGLPDLQPRHRRVPRGDAGPRSQMTSPARTHPSAGRRSAMGAPDRRLPAVRGHRRAHGKAERAGHCHRTRPARGWLCSRVRAAVGDLEAHGCSREIAAAVRRPAFVRTGAWR
ncbi:hypothetical protein AV521_36185 [Streptomyces sp. IMTB 2501]|nr:hypothetical protein AV521_36185 [Streptomyces sp. IMTB 2501]